MGLAHGANARDDVISIDGVVPPYNEAPLVSRRRSKSRKREGDDPKDAPADEVHTSSPNPFQKNLYIPWHMSERAANSCKEHHPERRKRRADRKCQTPPQSEDNAFANDGLPIHQPSPGSRRRDPYPSRNQLIRCNDADYAGVLSKAIPAHGSDVEGTELLGPATRQSSLGLKLPPVGPLRLQLSLPDGLGEDNAEFAKPCVTLPAKHSSLHGVSSATSSPSVFPGMGLASDGKKSPFRQRQQLTNLRDSLRSGCFDDDLMQHEITPSPLEPRAPEKQQEMQSNTSEHSKAKRSPSTARKRVSFGAVSTEATDVALQSDSHMPSKQNILETALSGPHTNEQLESSIGQSFEIVRTQTLPPLRVRNRERRFLPPPPEHMPAAPLIALSNQAVTYYATKPPRASSHLSTVCQSHQSTHSAFLAECVADATHVPHLIRERAV